VGVKRLAFALCLVVTGCGGQAMPGAGYGAKSEPDLGSELEAKAAEMERELASLESDKKPEAQDGKADSDGDAAGATADAEASGPVAEEAPPMAPPPAEAPAASGTEANETHEDAERTKKRDGCKTACRALDSMKRTEARICELVGDRHAKCTWAHERVKEAVARIERAQCSCKD
jgi:hypothetical protein